MDEKKRKLHLLEKTEIELDEQVKMPAKPKFSHPNQSNPIARKLAQFHNEKVGKKFSIIDLLR